MVDTVVAGHLCLDIFPDLSAHAEGQFDASFQPGRLVQVGPAVFSTGGAVSNTGLVLHRLGIETRLLAKVGADQFGQSICEIIANQLPSLVDGIRASPETSTSYSIVISPPGNDRRFLHHPGANDNFCADDVKDQDLGNARLFHFGYPPLMARMFADDGLELTRLFQRVKGLGLTTSLDMAYPDPASPAGKADWDHILRNTLPFVDIFLPSLDEILFMLGRKSGILLTGELLSEVSSQLLDMGAKIVVLKLGELGLYLRTASKDVLEDLGFASPSDLTIWGDFEAWYPCFQVKVAGTTGSGDATIAGFLAAFLRDLPPARALTAALAVGACCVEAADGLSGIRSWDDTWQRINAGWARRPDFERIPRKNNE
ncbi:MAG: carbohydrate kinase family protein [Chloroflexota bacterium]|nr:MAG: carbohydrate kinase family protein [Chloroflexota bacterium]